MKRNMKWEYKFTYIDSKISDKKTIAKINEELNAISEEGWELVNFVSASSTHTKYAFVFKRPKE